MNLRREAGVATVVLVVLWVIGCGSNQTTQSTSGSKSTTVQAPPAGGEQASAPAKPDDIPVEFKLTAAEYRAEYDKDDKEAAKKYGDKWVEVSGVVHTVERSGLGGRVTIGEKDAERFTFGCNLKDNLDPWKSALPGQTVRVRGNVSSVFPALQLQDCVIVSATGTGPATVAATELAKEYKADADEFKKKHPIGSYLILTGEIASVDPTKDPGFEEIALTQESDGAVVKCYFTYQHPVDKERKAKLIKGRKVKVLGFCGGSCSLSGCQLLE